MAQTDILKRYLDTGLAFTAMTQARAEALVKDLVKAGPVTPSPTSSSAAARTARSSSRPCAAR
jgi:polyhydroxyalkanoate synthesis regulator phasin